MEPLQNIMYSPSQDISKTLFMTDHSDFIALYDYRIMIILIITDNCSINDKRRGWSVTGDRRLPREKYIYSSLRGESHHNVAGVRQGDNYMNNEGAKYFVWNSLSLCLHFPELGVEAPAEIRTNRECWRHKQFLVKIKTETRVETW